MVIFGLFLTVVWMFGLYYLARIVIWFSLILVIICFAFLTYFCITRYNQIDTENKARFLVNSSQVSKNEVKSRDADINQVPVTGNPLKLVSYYFGDALMSKIKQHLTIPWLWLIFSIVSSTILVVLLVATFLLVDRINMSISLIKETSRYLEIIILIV